VWVHLFDPHAPYRPPPPFDAQYAGKPYFGEVAAVDVALGSLIDDVRAAASPTLVVVTGDHGEALGDHGEESHGLFAYESTLRVPLIVAELGEARLKPGTISAVASGFSRTSRGEVSSGSARHIDILPTILEAIGQSVPGDLPGRSLLTSAERQDSSSRPLYFEAMSAMLNRGWAPLTGVLVDRDKFIDLPLRERYDLRNDPAERRNLAGQSPDRDRALAAALAAFHPAAPGQRTTEDAQTLARLRSLGYVSGQAPARATYTAADDPKALVTLDRDVHRAVDAFTAGRAADAVQIYADVVKQRPDMAIAYRHLAFIQWQQGDVRSAIATLKQATGRGVSDPRVVAQLGGYLADAGRPAEAVAILEQLARDPAADPDTLNTLGIAYAQGGKAALAQQTFERVLAVNPESSVPLENLGLLALERRDLQAAGAYFDRAVGAAPSSSRAHAGVGIVALRRGDHQAAFDAWTRAVQLDPRNFEALYNLGVNLARDGQLDRARPYLEQFLRTAPQGIYASDRREVEKILAGSAGLSAPRRRP